MTAPVRPGVTARRAGFTFIEILIALAILGISLALAFSIVGAARERVLRAERRWARDHNLSQAAEFFLLAGPDGTPPPGYLPEGFSASCAVAKAEGLPENATEAVDGWVLGRYHITVRFRGSEIVAETVVEKLVREDEL